MTDRVAIVTGAGSGIGRGIAQYLAGNGVRVVVADVNDDGGAETVQQITGAGGTAMFVHTDVSLRTDAQAMVDACVSEYGTPDYLVNNAGLVTMTPFLELPETEWDLVLNVDVKGQFLCGQAFSRALVAAQQGGAIVNIASVESEVISASGDHCQVHYNVAKGGVKMLTKGMAFELARHDIRVNGINPGTIDTEFAGPPTEKGREYFFARSLIKRLGEPADIARAVWFLLSDDASFITGAMLNVDGGWLVQ
jgi:NAD(P)-dependent dehydrogenase (short-subunit alcohol dehydrogenase family)